MSPRAHAALHGFLLLHATIWLVWLGYAFVLASEPPQRDWFVLREVGLAFLHGEPVYVDRWVPEGRMFFQYPPFVLYPLTLLAVVPPMVAYAMVCGTQLAAAAATLVLLFRFARTPDADLAVAGVFGSAAMSSVIVSGQSSALLALVVTAAAVAVAEGRSLLAGALVGLLLAKPNWLPVLAVFVVWKGGKRALVGLGATVTVLLLGTLPLGLSTWEEFFRIPAHVQSFKPDYPAFKEITLLAFLKSLAIPQGIASAIWAVTFAVLGWVLVGVWRSDRPFGRQLAATTLFAVALNPYVGFYDGFVLTLPAVLWLAHRPTYTPEAWRRIGLAIAAYWLWDMAVFYYAPMVAMVTGPIGDPPISIAGLLLYVWFRAEVGSPRSPP